MNQITNEIKTGRLILRKFREQDLGDMFALYSDESVNVFLPWHAHKSLRDTEKYLHEVILPGYEKKIGYNYAVEWKQTGRLIGYVTVHDVDEEMGSGDLGYALLKEYWSRGIVTEACRAVLDLLKSEGFRRITATHDRKNTASGEVMKKLGMRYCYSYVEQWQPKDISVTFRLYQLDFDGLKNSDMKYWERYGAGFVEEIE